MNLKFWKKNLDKAEEKYRKIICLQYREKMFEKEYFDVAWQLEKQRHNGKEYVR